MSTLTFHIRNHFFIERLVLRKSFWLVLTLFFFGYPIYRSINRELPPELPIYFTLPEFQLTDENNKPFGSRDLEGKTYIASFFFSSCPTACPQMMSDLQRIQKRVKGLGTNVALVTFTVDPHTDNPAVLFKRARKLGANPHVWRFLTGQEQDINSLVVDGFKVPMGKPEAFGDNPDIYDIVHSQKMVLVDGQGQIRGYYDFNKVEIDKMMVDLGLLVNRAKFSPQNKES